MRLNAAGIFSLIIASTTCLADVSYSGTAVHELTEKTYDDFIKDNTVKLVEFFAPWCGHCQTLAPEYKSAAEVLKMDGVKLGSVDCTENEQLCAKKGVRGYPTIKLFQNGEEQDYEGPRVANGIVKFMRKRLGPVVIILNGDDELDAFKDSDEVVVLTGFNAAGAASQAFTDVAEKYRDEFTFGILPSLEDKQVVLYKKFDEGKATFISDGTSETLEKWILMESTPLMAEITPANYGKYIQANIPMAYLFYSTPEMRADVGELVKKVMKEHKGKINAVFIDGNEFAKHAEALTLPTGKRPGFVIHDVEFDLKYPFLEKNITEELLRNFVDKFVNNKLEPSYRSEEIPEQKADDPLRIVVSKNWNDIVLDENKDVLVEIYAPWCGACKRIAPTYVELAQRYAKHSDKIVIAKMDGTANDLPKSAGIKLTKYPTVYLFPAGSAKRTKGGIEMAKPSIEIQDWIGFIKKHATNSVDVEVASETAVKEEAKTKDHEEL